MMNDLFLRAALYRLVPFYPERCHLTATDMNPATIIMLGEWLSDTYAGHTGFITRTSYTEKAIDWINGGLIKIEDDRLLHASNHMLVRRHHFYHNLNGYPNYGVLRERLNRIHKHCDEHDIDMFDNTRRFFPEVFAKSDLVILGKKIQEGDIVPYYHAKAAGLC